MTEHFRTPQSAGQMLFEARDSLGLELRDIARETRLSLDALEAIEKNDWAALGAPIYARGFVKLYAEAVELDPRLPLALVSKGAEKAIKQPDAGAARTIEVGTARRTAAIDVQAHPRPKSYRILGVTALLVVLFALGWFSLSDDLDVATDPDDDVVLGVSPDGTSHSD